MAEYNTYAGDLRLVGGALCLDFANTANNHGRPDMKEYLSDCAALAAWAHHAGAISSRDAERLVAAARERPADAADTLARAQTLRNALHRLLRAAALGAPPASHDLAALNSALARLPHGTQLDVSPAGPSWNWAAADPLEIALCPVIWSAAELLTSPRRVLVRECAGPECTWLFLDTSRNHSRRWCSMEDCGNRAKAQRHYARYRRHAG